MPIRIQRQRIKGWMIPPNTVYVGRPSRWGNPYATAPDFAAAVRALRPMVDEMRKCKARGFGWDWHTSGVKWLDGTHIRSRMVEIVSACEHGALRGKDLACWCDADADCHADILLEIANTGDGGGY